MDKRNQIPNTTSKEGLQEIWDEWAEIHSYERLLTACFILDSRHSLLLGRATHVLNSGACLEQFVPAPLAVWDAPNPTQWTNLTQIRESPTRSIYEFLDRVENHLETEPVDYFQSALVISCYSASCTTTVHLKTLVLYSGTHNLFRPSKRDVLSKALCPQPAIQIMLRAVPLIAILPFRALISIAGESWFFSRKLSLDEFRRQKAILRRWTDTTTLDPELLPSSHATSPLPAPYPSTFLDAVSIANEIVSLALTTTDTHTCLAWGPELAIYLSTLVLWAATFAGMARANATGRAPSICSDSDDEHDREEWDIKQALPRARQFVAQVSKDVENAQMGMHGHLLISQPQKSMPTQTLLFPDQVGGSPGSECNSNFPPTESIKSWMSGVESIIGLTKWMLEGGCRPSAGAGELVDGTVRVLETLERRAWTRNWF
jgi:hypothetical protein